MGAGLWKDDTSTLDDVFRCCVFDFQNLACELETQMRGMVVVFDFNNFGMNKMRDLTPTRLKVVADLVQVRLNWINGRLLLCLGVHSDSAYWPPTFLQDTFPLKIQEIHMVNNPWYVHIILSMIWPFLTQKLRGRVSTPALSILNY